MTLLESYSRLTCLAKFELLFLNKKKKTCANQFWIKADFDIFLISKQPRTNSNQEGSPLSSLRITHPGKSSFSA